MSVKTLKVGIESDAIEQLSKVTIDKALEELIWNAIDADSSEGIQYLRNHFSHLLPDEAKTDTLAEKQ